MTDRSSFDSRNRDIIASYQVGASYKQLGAEFGLHPQYVGEILYRYRATGRGKMPTVHSLELIKRVVSLKGKRSASEIAREFGLASRCVVIGIWNRARKRKNREAA